MFGAEISTSLKNFMKSRRSENGFSGEEIFMGRKLEDWEKKASKVALCDLYKVIKYCRINEADFSKWWLEIQLRKPNHH